MAVGLYFRPLTANGAQPAVVYPHSESAESHGAQLALRAGASLTIAKPAGTQPGDVMIAALGFKPNDITNLTAPAGWTLVARLDNAAPTANSLAVYVRSAGGAEPAQYTWGITSVAPTFGVAGAIQSFSGVDSANPILAQAGQNTPASLAHSTPSIDTAAANAMLVATLLIAGSGAWSPPAGMSEAYDVATDNNWASAGVTLAGSYAPQAGAGASGAKTATASVGPGAGNAHLLALRPAAQAQAAQLYYIHPDHLNTPRLISNDQQQAVWRRDQQEPFGDSPADENPSGLGVFEFELGFPGQRRDRETGLWYNDQRDGYNPAIGGYTQPEPLGVVGDINLYRYARSNPLGLIDPDGLQAQSASAACGPYALVCMGIVTAASAAAATPQGQQVLRNVVQTITGGGNGCPPEDECNRIKQGLDRLYGKLSDVGVAGLTGAQRAAILTERRQFNKLVNDYNAKCASVTGFYDKRLTVGPQRPSLPGGRLLDDVYTK